MVALHFALKHTAGQDVGLLNRDEILLVRASPIRENNRLAWRRRARSKALRTERALAKKGS